MTLVGLEFVYSENGNDIRVSDSSRFLPVPGRFGVFGGVLEVFSGVFGTFPTRLRSIFNVRFSGHHLSGFREFGNSSRFLHQFCVCV